jgi:hypothetical protein
VLGGLIMLDFQYQRDYIKRLIDAGTFSQESIEDVLAFMSNGSDKDEILKIVSSPRLCREYGISECGADEIKQLLESGIVLDI